MAAWRKIYKGAYQIDGAKYRFIARKVDGMWEVTAAELQETAGVRHTIGVKETHPIGTEDTLAEAKEIVQIILDTEVSTEYHLRHEFRDAYLSSAYAEGSK